jgi:hypothetical protein
VIRTTPVANIDLAPTILDMAHARPLRVMDGRSLVPLMKDPGLHWGRDLLLEGSASKYLTYKAIHTPRYVYIEHAPGDRELYDLVRDPYQLHSLHRDPLLRRERIELHHRLQTLRTCSGATCRREPAVSLRLSYVPAAHMTGSFCGRSDIWARVIGADSKAVLQVEWRVAGRKVAKDGIRPFSRRLLAPSVSTMRSPFVRAIITLRDGRVTTLDRRTPSCFT